MMRISIKKYLIGMLMTLMLVSCVERKKLHMHHFKSELFELYEDTKAVKGLIKNDRGASKPVLVRNTTTKLISRFNDFDKRVNDAYDMGDLEFGDKVNLDSKSIEIQSDLLRYYELYEIYSKGDSLRNEE